MTTTPMVRPPYTDQFVIPKWCDEALRDIVEHYETKTGFPEGVPLPARRYWTIGTTAHDCEQCVLAVQQMFLGTAETPLELTQCGGPRGLTFTVEVVRCVPTLDNRGRAPDAPVIEAASGGFHGAIATYTVTL